MTLNQQPEERDEDDGEELLKASRFRVVRVQEACRDGSHRSRDLIKHPGSVAIVPLLDEHTVCLINVFRRAVGRTLIEIPAGTLDRIESLEAAAARELIEETGYRAESLEAVGSLWMSPGILRERMHLFVARGLTPGPQALEPGEQIETRVVGWDEAVAMCLDGRIEDAKTVAAILLTDQRRKPS
jgi:ADP-ribose pyrophosphatase